MAILQLENGTTYTQLNDIAPILAPLNIQIDRWEVGDNPNLHHLLSQDSLSDEEKERVLTALDGYFAQLKQNYGYQSRDLLVIHPAIPNLNTMMGKFATIHTHADDEVRYVIDGEGVFGFVLPDGSQVELTVQKEEYINVPAGTEHWFHLTSSRRIKAVRYFISTEGWVPQYTGRELRFGQEVGVG
ncbi:1,2-dihydroxy-3-keto-5-methylthiopentene dioxygenase [Aerosakkonema funiforme]|uniref:Acireductone dioxygenase n=1 Tax=Aerosakkonema funiforme FACHB-1375 TaxID=2949571 RepID=A0A926ZHV1_9CYAN|nr:cupin domain-containing protein [Aerosakkonema funiforme]MBD2183455.1 cupin domain-containing protein [Aerosakkonema funiforme FACHB-1375]